VAFHERDYDVYAILVGLEASRPWLAGCWRSISEATSSVFSAARDRPGIRSTQLGGVAPRMRSISFGRIAHDENGAAKWTHQKDGQLLSGGAAHFLSSEVWAPSWNACERDGKAPDVYLCITNEELSPSSGGAETLKFSSKCIFAVACDLGETVRRDGRRAAKVLSTLLASPLSAACVRPWGSTAGGNSFTNAINDISMSGLFRPGSRHETRPSLSLLKGDWTSLAGTLE
jgi:hypothetical protein